MYASHGGSFPGGAEGFVADRRHPQQGTMLQVEFSQLSDCGRRREHNEDYVGYVLPESPELARRRGWLFALADGVGGQDQGEVASHTAIESLLAGFRQANPSELHTALLPRLVQTANTHVPEAGMASG